MEWNQIRMLFFTNQSPLIAAARALVTRFGVTLKLHLCIQHVHRNIKHNFKSIFLCSDADAVKKAVSVGLSNAALALTEPDFFSVIHRMLLQLLSINEADIPHYIDVVRTPTCV